MDQEGNVAVERSHQILDTFEYTVKLNLLVSWKQVCERRREVKGSFKVFVMIKRKDNVAVNEWERLRQKQFLGIHLITTL